MNRVAQFRLKLTPRQRELLYIRLTVNADGAYDADAEHHDLPVGDEPWWIIFDRFPVCTWRMPAQWR